MGKDLLFSITKKDFEFNYFSGTGKGGQNRNRHKNCCRCFHRPSNSMGMSKEERSKEQNTKLAWNRCVKSDSFQKWLQIEIARAMGEMDVVDKKVEEELKNVSVEVRENDRWVELKNKYECQLCGYVYDPETDKRVDGVALGISFENTPDTWHCPLCGGPKSEFRVKKDE